MGTSHFKFLLLAACAAKPAPPVKPLPRAAYAHYLDAKLAGYGKDYATEATALKAALAAAPDQAMIAVELGRAQAKANDAAGAKATLADARAKWPHVAQVWLASGEVTGDPDMYRKAIELSPDDEHAYLGLAKIELSRKRPDVAEATLRVLIAHVPGTIDGHFQLAHLVTGAEQVHELRATIEHNPDHIDARLELARTLRKQGHLDEAIAQTRSAFDRAAQPLDIAEELFWLLCEADDRTAAIDLLTLLDDDRSEVDALAVVARLDRTLGRIPEARAVAARMAQTDTEAGAVALARAELADRNFAKARAAIAKLPKAVELRAQIELDAGEPAKVLAIIGDAPKDPELRVLSAFALADLGKKTEARALVPDGFARARLEDRIGDAPAAIAACEAVLAKTPNDAGALNYAGFLLADRGERLDVAEGYLRKARELSPGDPAVLDSWGWLLLKRGKLDQARKFLERAARYSPREPEIAFHLASAYAAAKAPREAREQLDRAVKLGPSPAVKARIDALRVTLGA